MANRHYCLDEIGDLTWTTQRSATEDRSFVVCAVCGRPRGETIDERDSMRRRLRTLASNLAIAAGLCESFSSGFVTGYHEAVAHGRSDPNDWAPGCGRTWPP